MKAKICAVRSLSICLIVLLGLMGFLLYVPEKEQLDEITASVHDVTRIPLADLAAVSIENDKMSFAVMQTADGLEVISKTQGTYDTAQLRTLLYAVCNLTGSRKITDQSTFENYGFSAPQAKVTLILKDGTKQHLSVLAQNPLDGNRYLYKEEDDAIYLVAQSVAELFLRTEADFFSHTVFPIRTQADYAKVEKLSLSFHGNGRDYTVTQTESGYYLTAPIHHRLASTYVNSALLDNILVLYADNILAADADLNTYGFDKPILTISLIMESKEYTALFVKDEKLGCLMADPVQKMVYQIEQDTVSLLMQDYTGLLGGTVFTYAAGDVGSISLTGEGTERWIEFTGTGDTLSITADGKKLDKEQRNELLSALNKVPVVGEITRQPVGDAVLTMTVTMRNGSSEQIAFIPVQEEYVAVMVNGTVNFVTTSQAVTDLRVAIMP